MRPTYRNSNEVVLLKSTKYGICNDGIVIAEVCQWQWWEVGGQVLFCCTQSQSQSPQSIIGKCYVWMLVKVTKIGIVLCSRLQAGTGATGFRHVCPFQVHVCCQVLAILCHKRGIVLISNHKHSNAVKNTKLAQSQVIKHECVQFCSCNPSYTEPNIASCEPWYSICEILQWHHKTWYYRKENACCAMIDC